MDTYTHGTADAGDGITLAIIHDDCPMLPRESCDELGGLAFHASVDLVTGGDSYGSRYDYLRTDADFREYLLSGDDVRVLLPLSLEDHGGSAGARLHVGEPIIGARACAAYLAGLSDDSDESENEWNGYAYVLAPEMVAEYGAADIRACRTAARCLTAQAGELGYYLEGNVWGWSVTVEGMPHLDSSMFGYYGEPDGYVLTAGHEYVDWAREQVYAERRERAEMEARGVLTA